MLDVSDPDLLRRVKDEVVAFARSLRSATEDKLYVFRPGCRELSRWVSQGVAEVANYAACEFDPEHALAATVDALSIVDGDRHIFYVFDRVTPSLHRRLARGARSASSLGSETSFWLIDLCPISGLIDPIPGCTHCRPRPLISNFLEELIDADIRR